MDKKELLKQIPKIDEVLKDQRLFVFFGNTARDLIVESVREVIDAARERILCWKEGEPPELNLDRMIEEIAGKIRYKRQKSLRRLINGTGTILHTNLGRARLSEETSRNVSEAAMNYSTLEYDLKRGTRGSRHDHIEKLIAKIVGTEGAMVVNNNASAVLLCLSALAKDKEVIVSRGELVEIGGSFRIPEIMELGGAHLREVGTTNKTKLDDYRNAIESEKTAVLLKVHTSNYKIMGFTAEVDLSELTTLGREAGVPVVYDLGSGLMMDLRQYGIDEPTVPESVRSGADVVTFSGDKLLGGPQAGIIIGKKQYIDRMK
jgi:L-seryl-tRNA(Ser) seleniumtransferase